MCGIFGAIGKFNPDQVKLLALLNEARGKDSYGLFNGRSVLRAAGTIRDGLTSDIYIEPNRHGYLLGHTRFATHGAVSLENCHPFQYGNIIGAHNGVVYNYSELEKACLTHNHPKTGKIAFEVDSQAIFSGLSIHGEGYFRELEAYWGLWWVDLARPEIVNLMMHSHELSFGRDEEGAAIYFSSSRSDLERIGVPAKTITDCEDGTIYRIDSRALEIKKEKVKGLKSHASPKDWRTLGGAATVGGSWADFYGQTGDYRNNGWAYAGAGKKRKHCDFAPRLGGSGYSDGAEAERYDNQNLKFLTHTEREEYTELEAKYWHDGLTASEENRLMELEKLAERLPV